MPRKLSIFTVFAAAFIVVFLCCDSVKAQNFYPTRIVNLNNVLAELNVNVDGTLNPNGNALAAAGIVTFTPTNEPYRSSQIIVSTTPMVSDTDLNYLLHINKTGNTTWRLGYEVPPADAVPMANVLAAPTENIFQVQGGILEFMNQTTLTLTGGQNGLGLQFSDGTTLNARGNNVITSPVTLGNNAVIGLDMTNYNTEPVLRIAGNVSLTNAANTGNIHLLGFTNKTAPSNVEILRFNYAGTLPQGQTNPAYPAAPIRVQDDSNGIAGYGANFGLQVRGEDWAAVQNASNGRLQGTIRQTFPGANTGGTSSIFIDNFMSSVGGVRWTGNEGSVWNATSRNWRGETVQDTTGSYNYNTIASDTFLHGDLALFGATQGEESITVQAGGVQIGRIGSLTTRNDYAEGYGMIINGGEYRFTNEADSLIGIDGPGRVLITGAAGDPVRTRVTFASANSYWGGTSVENRSILRLNNSAAVGTGAVSLRSGSELVFATGSANDFFYNSISAVAGTTVTKEGTNTVSLVGASVTGDADTIIREGTLQGKITQGVLTVYEGATYNATVPNNAAASGNRAIRGLSNYADPVTGLPNTGGTVNMGEYALSITVAPGSGTRGRGYYEFSGLITGNAPAGIEGFTGNITKYGLGTQVFSNDSNTYSGGTLVAAGTLVGRTILSEDIGDTSTVLRFRPFGTGDITVNEEATLRFDLFRDPAENPNGQPFYATFDNTIHGAGTLLKSGAVDEYGDIVAGEPRSTEILYLTSNRSDYTGKTDVREGKIRIRSVNSTGKTSEVALADGTALQFDQLTDSSAAAPYDRVVTGAGGVEVLRNDTNKTIAYVGGYNRTQDGTAPTAYSNYTGDTTVEGNSELHILDTYATGRTNSVQLQTATSDLYFEFASSKDENGQEQAQVYDRYITGDGNIIKREEGTVVLELDGSSPARPNDFGGTTTVETGTLKLAYAEATGAADVYDFQSVTINRDGILELAFEGTYDKGIQGEGVLAKSGEGTTSYLNGKSTYTGGTYLYDGTLSYSDLEIDTPGNLGRGTVHFLHGGGTLQNRNAVESFEQRVAVYAGSTATFDTLQDLTMTGAQGIEHQTVAENDPYYIPGDQKSHLVKMGGATMTIDSLAAWTGTTTVNDGVLANNIPEGTALTVNNPGTYYTGQSHRSVSLLLGNGNVLTEQNFNFTVNNTETSTFSGAIGGSGNLVKDGAGLLRLTGNNIYSGDTVVNNGTLDGNITSGTDLTVNAAGTYISRGNNRIFGSLQGSGTVDMMDGSVVIHQTDAAWQPGPVYTGKILNANRLVKTGDGIQTLAGLQYKFAGDIAVEAGTLGIGGINSNTTQLVTDKWLNVSNGATFLLDRKGKVEAVNGNVNIDGTLVLNLDNNSVTAQSFSFGDHSHLDVRGIGTSEVMIPILKSSTAIEDNFATVTVGGESAKVDYLTLGVSKSADKKIMYVGQSLSWYAVDNAHGNFTLNGADSSFEISRELADVTETFDPNVWDGKTLRKKGIGTLILSADNTYTGATVIEAGTLKLTREKAVGGSSGVELTDSKSILDISFDSRDASGNWTEGFTTSVSGVGGLVKTGKGTLALLSGVKTYTGSTVVEQGGLLIDGGLSSQVWVREFAGFGGNGIISNNVYLEDGSHYYWRFGASDETSDTLTVQDFYVGENVTFKPIMSSQLSREEIKSFTGWDVVRYTSGLYGKFAGVDSALSPFYDFELDYNTDGYIRINGNLRNAPNPLSDVVATSLSMAQTRMFRSAYQQIAREWMSECPEHPQYRNGQTRGQSGTSTRTAWMNFIGRGEDFASNYHHDNYNFQSYGVQAGMSLLSNCNRSFGILFGREEGKLHNRLDEVRNEDYYLGLYYGQIFANNLDMRSYIGGGWQNNWLTRTHNENRYKAGYDGNTYNMNIEFGRRFIGQRGWIIRPYAGADLQVSRIGSALETSIDDPESNEYRKYRRSELVMLYTRLGIETSKSWGRFDFHSGANLAWNFGDARPFSRIYYPAAEQAMVRNWVDGSGARLGRFDMGINAGMNWFLTERRNTLFFLDYNADIYFDRAGDTTAGTGTLGFVWRF